ncbi:RNA polymerase RpoN-/SigL-like sigma 54 subunit [Natranaerovirga pectinivora]|uniref:RNA polymerase RpoN-/SigL-like sigma 54 subunit n=1 Tax=Natranaerovirga pectinivora TaxID=682400 RepID=A0A4R3MMP1_9FIRM|nr:RNA polymerase factor sigma-54 [Natranaerovirga pectinivora]TCT15563.1 RNA polymerase RpoN-/SigL-like sigma 54 subunit [Natranaerovirga pectinivora]
MKLDMQLNQNMEQNQHLSQKMIQAISILEMNNEELILYIKEQMLENPILDWKDNNIKSYDYEIIDDKNKNLLTSYEDLLLQWKERAKKISKKSNKNLVYKVGLDIIENINDQGYLEKSVEAISKAFKINTKDVERILKNIQSLEPIGIGSRHLGEYLSIQLKNLGYKDDVLTNLVEEHIQLLGKKQWKTICEILNISREQLKGYLELLSSLSPRIPFKKENKDTVHIQPELKVIEKDGVLTLEWIDETIPNLYIPEYYLQIMNDENQDEQAKEYIINNIDKARWLMRNIEERRKNIYNVANYIMRYQEDFIKYGDTLKPLSQSQVSKALGLSNSTISRVVNNKYIETPKGLFEIKDFFSQGLPFQDVEISNKEIMKMIEDIIKNENKRKPLSDEKIKDLLVKKGVQISRRTVTKYRLEMNILSSVDRKEL